MSTTLVLPAAGRSTRFGGGKPKWLLTQPNGKAMIVDALSKLDLTNVKRIVVILLKEHVDKYLEGRIDLVFNIFKDESYFRKLDPILLDAPTNDQSMTVYQGIVKANITGPIFVKDCDNCYRYKIEPGNFVCTKKIDNTDRDIGGKSFIVIHHDDLIENIVEKKVISDRFCVGGYSFSSAEMFSQKYRELVSLPHTGEIYISHVIYGLMLEDKHFRAHHVIEYEDWGTLEAWTRYKQTFNNLLVDIDGTLVKSSAQHFPPFWGTTGPLEKNIEVIRRAYNTGRSRVILMTSRDESFKEATENQMKELDVPYHQIIYGLFHAVRYTINDYNTTTMPYPTTVAVNLPRDEERLPDILKL